ncbi:MAG: hypothetical protein ACI4XM_07675 [Candidatus Coprovivens sp.]
MSNNLYGLYEDIIGTLSTYFFVIDYWKNAGPRRSEKRLHKVLYNNISAIRTEINSLSILIARLNEKLNNMDPKEQTIIDTALANIKSDIIPDSRITCKPDFTSDDSIRQQIKNCLAHSNFIIKEVIENDKKIYYIYFENEKIEGYMTLNELQTIKNIYQSILEGIATKTNILGGLKEIIEQKSSNLNVLKQSIDKMLIVENFSIPNGINPDTYNQAFLELASSGRTLTDEEKEKIFYYIKYIGITNWISLPVSERKKIIDNNFHHLLENTLHAGNNIDYILYPFLNALNSLTKEGTEKFQSMHYEAPFAYTSSLLELGYFCFNYLREAEKKEELEGFNYNDFKTKKINPQTFGSEPAIKIVDEPARYNNELLLEQNRKQKLENEINSKNKEIQGLQQSNVPEPKKTNLINMKQTQLALLQTAYSTCLQNITDITEKQKKAKVYKDYKNLFRHMRNSFAHGFYKIDYVPGFKSRNLEDTIFTFEDYDIDKTTNNKVKVFELSITADSLYQLLKEFSERIFNNTEQLEYQTIGVLTNINHHNKNIKKQADNSIKKLEEKYGPIVKL